MVDFTCNTYFFKEVCMNRILCSTGGVIGRPNGRDITLLKSCVENLDCDGFEFMMYETWYDKIDYIRDFVLGTGVLIPSFHIEKQVGNLISRNADGDTEKALELFDINCRLAHSFGAETLVLHLWSGLDSDKDIAHNIALYKDLRTISDSYGLLLTVENVVCNHLDPHTHLLSLAKEYDDIAFTFDTKMSQFHGQTEKLYLPESRPVADRVRHLHVNDYGGGYMDWSNLRTLHIGDGNVDFASFFEFVKAVGYKGDLTVEATSFGTDGIIDFNSLNRDFCKIREYLK